MRGWRRTQSVLLWTALFCFWAVSLEALEDTSSFTVAVIVAPICTVATVPLNFGTMVLGEIKTQTVEITTKCTKDSPFQLVLDAGLHGGGGVRNMADTDGNLVPYRLYKDTAQSVEWTEGIAGVTNAIGTGLAVPHTLHGVTTPPALVPAGIYTDIVTATILF